MATGQVSARQAGRPREFDRAEALSSALGLFLRRGFVSASVTDLTQAMGINRPSLYAAFGSKERLFKDALYLHARRHLHRLRKALAEPTAAAVAERLLRSAATEPMLAGGVGGFMGLLSSLPDDLDLAPVREEILAYQIVVMNALEDRFADAQRMGEIGADLHPAALAFLLEAMSHAISVRARSGASAEDIDCLIKVALSAMGCG
ncbi:TetR family transcriptional regulator [Nostoc sp. 3335mG]|nr:TetR family transcriptional regulator [Nostoc sp. 3335mG]